MKIAFFDCFAGASGDMILGALIDSGLDIKALENEFEKLPLTGYKLKIQKLMQKGLSSRTRRLPPTWMVRRGR